MELKTQNYLKAMFEGRLLLYCAIGLFVLKLLSIFAYINFPANIFYADITKTAIIELTNRSRAEIGLNSLSENSNLDQAASLKAQDMVQKEYFSHNSPDGITPWYWFYKTGYSYKYAGENLAIGFFESQDVLNAWLNSQSHRNNLLNPNYKEIGVAVMPGFGKNNAIVVVQLFGSKKISPVVNQAPATVETKPEIKQEAPEAEEQVQPKVLSQETESAVLQMPKNNSGDSFYLKALNFFCYDFHKYIQLAIFIFWILAIAILYFSLPKAIENHQKKLLFRSVIIVLILSAAMFINEGWFLQANFHQLII